MLKRLWVVIALLLVAQVAHADKFGPGETVIEIAPGILVKLTVPAGAEVELDRVNVVKLGGPTTPTVPNESLAQKVREWAEEIGDPDTAALLAIGRRAVVDQIRKGAFDTKQEAVDAQKAVDAVLYGQSGSFSSEWRAWERKVALELTALQSAGQVNDLNALASVYSDVATGLEQAGADSTKAFDIGVIIKLVLAIISRDQAAIIEAILALIASIGS